MPNHKETPFSGTVTARNCPTCGHHEIGLVSENGVFRPLRTGTKVLIMDKMEPAQISTQGSVAPVTCETQEEPAQTLEGSFWVPEPLKGDRRLRLKYGVVVQKEFGAVPVTEHIYESAYVRKLSYLLENEVNVPIAVILDRFFVAPHLASGESGDMANNMWEELEEIRRPVEQITKWIKEPNEETVQLLVHPDTIENLEKQPISEDTALEELRALNLEDFLELL